MQSILKREFLVQVFDVENEGIVTRQFFVEYFPEEGHKVVRPFGGSYDLGKGLRELVDVDVLPLTAIVNPGIVI